MGAMDEIPERVYAWVGMDELGSGVPGLKQANVPAGCIPLVATKREKIDQAYIETQLQAQATEYGVTIRLVRYDDGRGIKILKELKP